MGGLRRFFVTSTRKAAADVALGEVGTLLAELDRLGLRPVAQRAASAARNRPAPGAVWADFARRSADCIGLLAGLVDLGEDVAAAEGFLPAEIVERINAQQLDDDVTSARRPGVLVAQITAGGTGLNIQVASVVILCEPQVKPSLEAQAVARAHRMGQVRTVQVHRLLVADSVDQRMLEILGSKQALFDAYVRDSVVTAAAPGAVDISEVQLARMIVEQEQKRLAMETMGQNA